MRLLAVIMISCQISTAQVVHVDPKENHNEYLYNYCERNMGKKVADGDCLQLVTTAMDSIYPDFYDIIYNDSIMEKHQVAIQMAKPGDIILFYTQWDASTRSLYKTHIGVVWKAFKEHIYYYNQNVCDEKDMRKIVRDGINYLCCPFSQVFIGEWNFKSGYPVKIFRF